jgi:2-dehydropantoate 2-reductase
MNEPLRLAFVGPGAIGLFYAARLANAGAQVSLLLRSDYEAVKQRGIETRGCDPVIKLGPDRIRACRTPEELGPVDLVVVTLKTTANEQFGSLISPLLGPDTAILTLQNGLGSDTRLAELFGAERVLGGLCYIACNRVAPGVAECFFSGTISIGEFGRPIGERARRIGSLFDQAGIPCRLEDSLEAARWKKLVWNVPYNGLCIAAGITSDKVMADPFLAAEARALMYEIRRAAAALGYEISEKFIDGQLKQTPKLGAYKPSSMIDWEAGREVEVETIWGEPLRRATAAGVDCPRFALLYALLRQLCRPKRG